MPSRRSILAAVAAVGAGCSTGSESDVDPADHVPDNWHEDPKRGLADPLTMSTSRLSQRPQSDCPHLAAETAAEVLEDRLGEPENVHGGELSREVDGHDRAIVWVRNVTLSRDGEVVSSPTIEFRTVREAAPRTIAAPEESDHDCQVPVYVVDRSSRLV